MREGIDSDCCCYEDAYANPGLLLLRRVCQQRSAHHRGACRTSRTIASYAIAAGLGRRTRICTGEHPGSTSHQLFLAL
jgi:hypothetical protein